MPREVARGFERLRGLAFSPPGAPLEIPRCRSVHTFGMRYALDLVWLADDGSVVRVDRDVPPRRVRVCRRARSVVEVPAGAVSADDLASVRFGGLDRQLDELEICHVMDVQTHPSTPATPDHPGRAPTNAQPTHAHAQPETLRAARPETGPAR